jgi:hypothetical protein
MIELSIGILRAEPTPETTQWESVSSRQIQGCLLRTWR